MTTDTKLITICVTIVFSSMIASTSYYNMQKDRLMSANIENGITKGVDPIAIKCAYDSSSTICLVYAASKRSQ